MTSEPHVEGPLIGQHPLSVLSLFHLHEMEGEGQQGDQLYRLAVISSDMCQIGQRGIRELQSLTIINNLSIPVIEIGRASCRERV